MNYKEKQHILELQGEDLLNQRPEFYQLCELISDCSCSARWCEHDLRNLAALESARHMGHLQGLQEANELIKKL